VILPVTDKCNFKMRCFLLSIICLFILYSCEKKKENDLHNWEINLFQTDFEYQRISVADNNIIYVFGIKLNNDNSGLLYTLIKSLDNGITWQKVNIEDLNYYQMGGWNDMCFIDEQYGLITGYRTLFITNNGGINWDTTYLGYDNFNNLEKVNGRIFAFNGMEFRYSDNEGENWIKYAGEPKYVSSLSFQDDKEGFASSATGLYKTKDGGNSWTLINEKASGFLRLDFFDSLHGIATSQYQSGPHAYPYVYLNLTADGGLSWSEIWLDSISSARLEPESSILYKDLDEIYAGCVNGIYMSDDNGLTWKHDYVDTLYGGGIWIRDIKLSDNKIIAAGWGGLILTKE
jgi:photosystem II stability/assembly factor-like uncharacterized protein